MAMDTAMETIMDIPKRATILMIMKR
jgi:hypothetical protein